MAKQFVYQPHPALKHLVRYYWSLDIRLTGKSMLNIQIMADRFPRIVIQCLNGKNALHSSQYENVYAASLKGITSKPTAVQMEPTYSHIAVSFFPHSINALFGIGGDETVDKVLDLSHFFPRDLVEQIIEAPHHHQRVSLLDAHLLKRLATARSIDWRVENFMHVSPNTIYRQQINGYGISERQFERKFLHCIGFTPSYYKRVLRFENILHSIRNGHFKTLADLAYASGYADQSHFNREFKAFSCLTPMEMIARDGLVKESGSLVSG